MVEGSVTRTTGVMTEYESIEAFCDGLLKCASAARELARETENPDWIQTSAMLDAMRVNGVKLSKMKSMSRLETMMAANIKAGSGLIV